jgi:dTDP-D-glucose 4,6-dehydratase
VAFQSASAAVLNSIRIDDLTGSSATSRRRVRRHAIDFSFAERELRWKPLHNAREGIASTVDWYLNDRNWWEPLLERTGRY